jgi:hypothetical protein
MASLLMADDLYEMEQALKAAQSGRLAAQQPTDAKLGRRLGKLAKRAEDIAVGMEHP